VVIGEVPLELRKKHDVARVETEGVDAHALLVVVPQEPGENRFSAQRDRKLEAIGERQTVEADLERVGVVVDLEIGVFRDVLPRRLE